ncbi:hypothetical protein K492DRAFT_142543 [Lichtheimia hyalospora FSU 10163]|nr:hypothetical protein K492DRAFT_142543 [Lichtheimia hyalospora FSU 10163]
MASRFTPLLRHVTRRNTTMTPLMMATRRATLANTNARPMALPTMMTSRCMSTKTRTIKIPPLPLAFIGVALACLGVGLYEYLTSDIQKYPPPVRQALRKALYYQHKNEHQLALKYFREALDQALVSPELERDSAHLTGIMIQLGSLLESLGRLPEARQTFVLALRHLVNLDETTPDDAVFQVDLKALSPLQQKKIVAVAQKLGDILARMRNRDQEAERYYAWSIEHLLRLSSRPRTTYENPEDVVFDKEHMPSWLTQTEIGAALEAFGAFYAERNRPGYAIPLYLQALDLAGLKTCHATVLMNNLSDGYAALGKLEDAKQWAQRGLDLAQNPNTRKANKDGQVCDETCGVLLFNMGMLLEQSNEKEKAAQFYQKAVEQGRELKLVELVQQANRGLRRVEA